MELSIRSRKINIFLVFIMQSYFAVPKNIKLNPKHYFMMKIPNKHHLQQIDINSSPNTDFMKLQRIILSK